MHKCKHCGKTISSINYALGREWMHIPEGNPSEREYYKYCKLSRAEPKD